MPDLSSKLLSQLTRWASAGHFGPKAADGVLVYQTMEDPIEAPLRYITDYYGSGMPEDIESQQLRDYFCQVLVVVYREAKKVNPTLARAFARAFFEDVEGRPGSTLLTRWNALAEASFAFKWSLGEKATHVVWQQSSRLVLAYNEFLSGLLGLLIVAWKCGLGREYNLKVLDNNYGSKIREFSDLTNGENGVFYAFLRIAKNDIRNAIAHGDVWLDQEAGLVRFKAGSKEMSVLEFLAFAKCGTHLGEAYIAAVSVMAVAEEGGPEAMRRLPSKMRSVLALA